MPNSSHPNGRKLLSRSRLSDPERKFIRITVVDHGRIQMSIRNFVKAVSLVLTASFVLGFAGTAKDVRAAGIRLSGSSYVQK